MNNPLPSNQPGTPDSQTTVEINPSSCLSTTLWRGKPGESVRVEIQGLWRRVIGEYELSWNGPESVDLVLLLEEAEQGQCHRIGPLPYTGNSMCFGPYDFQVALTARVRCDYVSDNDQNGENPLRATISVGQKTERPHRRPRAFEENEAA